MNLRMHAIVRSTCTAFAGTVVVLAWSAAHAADAPARVRFNRDIGPVLSENCFACHGPDHTHRKADLRLDTKDGLFGKVKHGAAVVPGDVAKSELIARITSGDPDEVMPPPKT